MLDPQGQTIRKALNAHGHPEIEEVRQGKYFDIAFAEHGHGGTGAHDVETIAETSRQTRDRELQHRNLVD